MSAISSNSSHIEPDKQLKNFLTLKAKVIHTDELIRRYREKGQECLSLQEQLRQALGQEASLQQSLVGLKAEVSALMREKQSLQDTMTASQWEKELAEARATNAELVVQQLTAQVEAHCKTEACLREERDRLAERCSQLQDQLEKAVADKRGSEVLPLPLQWSLSGSRRRHHSFSSFFSLPTSFTLSSEHPPLTSSLPSDFPPAEEGDGEEANSETADCLPETEQRLTDLDLSLSDSSSEEENDLSGDCQLQQALCSPPSTPCPSPLVHAAADTMNCDSDSELSLSEVESLSPIPPSPQPRPPTLSPLPLSPTRQTLSPLPSSPPPTSFQPSPLPQFVSAAPNTCRVPVPSVCVTSSPPPIVSPSHPHLSILHRSHLSPFSASKPQQQNSPALLVSPTQAASPSLPLESHDHSPLPVGPAQPSPLHQPLPAAGRETEGDHEGSSTGQPEREELVTEATSEETANSVTEEAECTQGGEAEGTPGGGAECTPGGGAECTPGGGAEGTPGGEAEGTPGGEAECTPGGGAEGTPGGEVEGTPGGGAEGTPGGGAECTPGGEAECTPGGEAEGTPGGEAECTPVGEGECTPGGEAECTPGGEVEVSERMDVSSEDVAQSVESSSLKERTGEPLLELEEGEISEEEERKMPEKGEERTNSSSISPTEEGGSRPDQLAPPPGLPGSTEEQHCSREGAVKRRPSDFSGAPQPKATKLSSTSEEESDGVGLESGGGARSSTSEVRVESVREGDQASAAGVGYSSQPPSEPAQQRPPSASFLTDGATGQVEELPNTSSTSQALPATSGTSSLPRKLSIPPSMLQQSLCADLRCPLPLPGWLLTTMVRLQTMSVHNPRPFRKKKTLLNCRRQPKQKPTCYVGNVVERVVTGQAPLSTAVTLLADPWNCSNPSIICLSLVNYLKTCYMPRIEHVMTTYNSLCNDVRSKVLVCPTSPSFPPALIRPECQLLALLYHTSKLNPAMAQLLPEVASALSTAALSPLLNFHKMAAVTRLFTAVCRLLEQRERVLFLACDLLRKPLSPPELPVVTGMVGVWPVVFARRLDMEVVVSGRLNPAAVELQPLSYAVEVVVTATMRQGGLSQHHVSKLHTLCGWSRGQTISAKTVDKLALVLLQLLQTSRRVTVVQEPCQGWCRPRPSHLTFHLVHTLRMLSWFKGWVWTSDVLIKAHVWPILQAWNSKKDSVPEATVMAVVRLLGFIGQQGVGCGGSSLAQLHKVLLSLLVREETPLSVQLCAAESLIDLCPPSLSSSREAVAVLWQWLRGLAGHPAGPHLSREFCPKLSTAPPHLATSSHPPPSLPLVPAPVPQPTHVANSK